MYFCNMIEKKTYTLQELADEYNVHIRTIYIGFAQLEQNSWQ